MPLIQAIMGTSVLLLLSVHQYVYSCVPGVYEHRLPPPIVVRSFPVGPVMLAHCRHGLPHLLTTNVPL